MASTDYVPVAYPRRWMPEDITLKTWEEIEPWYRGLLDRPVESPEELENWLYDVGELNGAVGQEGVERYIAMTCQTDDPVREARIWNLYATSSRSSSRCRTRSAKNTLDSSIARTCRGDVIMPSTASLPARSTEATSPARPSSLSWSSSIRRRSVR